MAMEQSKAYLLSICIALILTSTKSHNSTTSQPESIRHAASGSGRLSICKLDPCSMSRQSPTFKTPAGFIPTIYIMCGISAADAKEDSCELPVENITSKIDKQFALETITAQFLLLCPTEYKLKVIFSKASDKKMSNLISYLVLRSCDVSLENVGLFGSVVDLRVLYIVDFTELINSKLSFIDTTQNDTREPSTTTSQKSLSPMPGLENVGSLSFVQTTNQSMSIPLALYNHLWPVMAEIVLTNLTAHAGGVNEFKSTMPKLQDLNLVDVLDSGLPEFPWCRNSLMLPRQLIRTKDFNVRYSRRFLDIKPNVYLRSFTLSGTSIRTLRNVTFNGELYMLDLSKGLISSIDCNTFNHLKGLQWLILRHNLITDLPNGVFQNLTSLKRLDLSYNQLVGLDKEVFLGLHNLMILRLNNNRLMKLGLQMFCYLSFLNELDLSDNNIESVSPDAICFNMKNLTKVDLSNNKLHHFPLWVFATKSLTNADLSENKLSFSALKGDFNTGQVQEIFSASTSVIQRFKPAFEKQITIKRNIFSELNLQNETQTSKKLLSVIMSFFKLDISENKILCNCKTFSLRQFFQAERAKVVENFELEKVQDYYYETWKCSEPDFLKGQPIVDAPASAFYCEKDLPFCPMHCSCYERIVDQSVLVNCSNRGLTTLPECVPNGTDTLYISNNKLTDISRTTYLKRLKLLDISYNTLTAISSDVIPCLDNIGTISLHNNEIQYLPRNFNILKRVRLSLRNNIFICDCHSKWLVKWLIAYKDNITDIDRITCDSGKLRSQIIFKANEKDFICDYSNTTMRTIAICLGVFIVVLILFTIIIYKFRGEIKVFLYFRFNLHPFDKPDDTDVVNKLYDAFVSYSKADVKWVVNSLRPVLETEERPYRLCIHERDFEPGGLITDNILYSVKYSRRMIMVLTRDFLKSHWCRLEFRSAHTRVLKDRTNYLIVILFDNIRIDELDEDMKLYLRTNTYIEYNSNWFWQRLFYAMPKKPLLELREDLYPNQGFKTLFPLPKSVAAMQIRHNRTLRAKGEQPIDIVLDDEFM